MLFEIPIFRQILNDTKLAPRELQVFRAAIEYLDVVDWRELKLQVLEHHLDLDKAAVSRALGALVDAGYLCRQRQLAGRAMYRVPLSRHGCAEATEEMPAEEPTDHVQPIRRRTGRVVSRGVL